MADRGQHRGDHLQARHNAIYAVAGAFSSCTANLICQPLDVIKVRFQLQVEPIKKHSSASKYRGVIQAARLIVREEKLRALWKGLVPSQTLTAAYGVLHFGVLETLKSQVDNVYPGLGKAPGIVFIASSVSSCTAAFLSFPLYLVKTRMIAQGNRKMYRGMLHALVGIYRKEKMYGLFRGLTPALLQITPMNGATFAFFSFFKEIFVKIPLLVHDIDRKGTGENEQTLSVTGGMLAGSISGLLAKSLLYPLDLTVKRMQIQGFHSARTEYGKQFVCTGLFNCFRQTIQHESLSGLYKGLIPSLIKSVAVYSLMFTMYEQVCGLGNFNNKQLIWAALIILSYLNFHCESLSQKAVCDLAQCNASDQPKEIDRTLPLETRGKTCPLCADLKKEELSDIADSITVKWYFKMYVVKNVVK